MHVRQPLFGDIIHIHELRMLRDLQNRPERISARVIGIQVGNRRSETHGQHGLALSSDDGMPGSIVRSRRNVLVHQRQSPVRFGLVDPDTVLSAATLPNRRSDMRKDQR